MGEYDTLSSNVSVFIERSITSIQHVCASVCVFVRACVSEVLAVISWWRLGVIAGCGGALFLWLLPHRLNCLEDKRYKETGKRTRRKKETLLNSANGNTYHEHTHTIILKCARLIQHVSVK